MKIAVVGAGGFVGKALTNGLLAGGDAVVPFVRTPGHFANERPIDDLNAADWAALLAGADAAVLTAARVHIMHDRAPDPLASFLRVNRDGAVAVLRGAIEADVRRLVFVSTVKVNGEATEPGHPFKWDDVPRPQVPYGVSKLEAEEALKVLAAQGGIELVIVRPTVVYGPGVGANFQAMMRWIRRGVPLPLGAVTGNRRSLVGIDNLIDLLALCVRAPEAAGGTFFASDGHDVSTAALLREVGRALGTPARLLPVPVPLLTGASNAIGKAEAVQRLTGSLQVDIAHNRKILGWTPPVTFEQGICRAAQAFLNEDAATPDSSRSALLADGGKR